MNTETKCAVNVDKAKLYLRFEVKSILHEKATAVGQINHIVSSPTTFQPMSLLMAIFLPDKTLKNTFVAAK